MPCCRRWNRRGREALPPLENRHEPPALDAHHGAAAAPVDHLKQADVRGHPRMYYGRVRQVRTNPACAVRQMAGPSSIHSLPTEQYNQDVVSLGMHSAVTAMDALEADGIGFYRRSKTLARFVCRFDLTEGRQARNWDLHSARIDSVS